MSSNNFYEGANYGFDPEYGGLSHAYSSNPITSIGMATDGRTANQLKAVSEKLNTGATVIEVEGVSSDVFESIPQEHFQELNRLRKIVGGNTELTLHAPIVEPTGLSNQGWDASRRQQAETQMFDAVQKAHELNPNGNVVTTFHASAIGMPGEVKVWEGEGKNKREVVKEIHIFDETTGDLKKIPIKTSPFEGNKPINPEEELKKLNKSTWYRELQHLSFATENGSTIMEGAFKRSPELPNIEPKGLLNYYQDLINGKTEKLNKAIDTLEKSQPGSKEEVKERLQRLTHGDVYLRDAYSGLRELFDKAYFALQNSDDEKSKQDLAKLDKFRNQIAPKLDYIEDANKIQEFSEEIRNGIQILRSINPPKVYKPFKNFALDKSSETFSNLAFKSYKEFKENSPIISIENPPAGAGVIYNGQDLKELIDKTRGKFAKKAVQELGMSEDAAKKQAEKVIGATWDLGHINMIRKFGAGKEELLKEAKAIAPVVKHVHLSDNFGMEHTELPMGMGNVPTKETIKIIDQYNQKAKKIIEAHNWYQHFQTTPFSETLQHFGAPLYSAANVSNSYLGQSGGYFAGYGMNPDIHHSMYGSGFSNLPVELGGQMSGRSRVSGNPME